MDADRLEEIDRIFQSALDLEPEQLRQLAYYHRQRDPVHVAVADGLGEQLSHETEAKEAAQDTHDTRHNCHRRGNRYGPLRISRRQWEDDAEDDRRKR